MELHYKRKCGISCDAVNSRDWVKIENEAKFQIGDL